MDIVLLDWTRMGRYYCLAGVIVQAGEYRIVRPLPALDRHKCAPINGWFASRLDGHSRWEVFEMVQWFDKYVKNASPRSNTAAR